MARHICPFSCSRMFPTNIGVWLSTRALGHSVSSFASCQDPSQTFPGLQLDLQFVEDSPYTKLADW